jgi:UDP-GlcNAc:undecaprenyl-phosphate GlcNAc-1-phosphate transferase
MFITVALIPVFRRLAIKLHAMDVPDERKVHPYPIPKSGGMAMAIGTLIPVVIWSARDPFVQSIILGAGILAVFGVIDDFRNLSYKAKFLGQLAAALVAIFFGEVRIVSLGALLPEELLLPAWVSIPLTLVVIVGVTNAINLSDGLDGLAGGICLLSFICVGYLAYCGDQTVIAVLAVAVVGAIFGFLRFNTHPATLFMGDAGSQFLGFLAVTLSLKLTQSNAALSPILPLVILGFPILDTLTVMLERIREGKSPFVADKKHFHHRLMRLGLFHTEAVFVIYVIQSLLVTGAFVFRFYSEWLLLVLYTGFSGLVVSAFYAADRTGWTLNRTGLFDRKIKGRLRVLKDKQIFIRVCFGIVEYCLPGLLLFTCFLPASVPRYVAYLGAGLACLVLLTWVIRRSWAAAAIRLALYLLVPFVIYLSELEMVSWMQDRWAQLYDLSFGVPVLFVMLTLRLTRRKKGFKITPMDFLILFIALVVPNLPDETIQSYQMGLLAAKVIVLYFSFEVLIGELRGDVKKLLVWTLAVLAVVIVRGLMG